MDKLTQVKLTELVMNPKDDIVDGPFGSRLKASEYVDAGIPIVRLQNIDRNQFIDKNIKFVTKAKAKEIARHHFVSGDILISKLGDPLGEACIAPEQFPYGILVADVVRVRPDKRKVDTSFLAYALNSAPVVQQFKAETKGTTRPRVNLKKIRDLRVPIVESIAQQQQIVAEIEKQFTRLDAGVAALRRVQANLKRYRAAVLKAACEGRLVPTEAELAKAEGRTCKTGEQLLARILADRRKNWHGRGKYKEPAASDTTNLPPLPEGWAWARLEQLGVTYGGLTKNPKRAKLPNQLPYLRVANVYANELRLNEIEYIGVADSELEKLLVRAGDLLIVEGNGSKDQIGRLAIWDGSIDPCVHQNHLIKVRLVNPAMSKWILYWLQSRGGRHFVELVASSTSGLYTLSVNKVGDLPVLLPPLAEQTRIVAEVERRLSVIEELDAAVAANLQRGTRLRQSILHRAFSDQ
jgi:type I restriction enzyme S subunit